MVEKSVIVTCNGCSGYGEVVCDISHEIRKKTPKKEKEATEKEQKKVIEKESPANLLDLLGRDDRGWRRRTSHKELVDNYAVLIKNARESKKMKQKELARAINEPSSMIHRMESGHMKPSLDVAKKIQQKLGISLLELVETEEGSDIQNQDSGQGKMTPSGKITLGDMIVIKKRGG